jgi:hypothetical protein
MPLLLEAACGWARALRNSNPLPPRQLLTFPILQRSPYADYQGPEMSGRGDAPVFSSAVSCEAADDLTGSSPALPAANGSAGTPRGPAFAGGGEHDRFAGRRRASRPIHRGKPIDECCGFSTQSEPFRSWSYLHPKPARQPAVTWGHAVQCFKSQPHLQPSDGQPVRVRRSLPSFFQRPVSESLRPAGLTSGTRVSVAHQLTRDASQRRFQLKRRCSGADQLRGRFPRPNLSMESEQSS